MGGIGLTRKEIKEIRRVWGIVTSNVGQHPGQHGVEILLRLFAAYPEYQNYFKKFNGMSMEELRHTPMLRAHASSVMHGITTFLDKLDNKNGLRELIKENVGRHFGRNVKYEQYRNILNLVPGYLQDTLAEELTQDSISTWNKVMDTICDIIKQEVDKLENPVDEILNNNKKDKKSLNPESERCCIS